MQIKKINKEAYLEMMQTLGKSTDEYLFLWELTKDRLWIFGDMRKSYNLFPKEENLYSIEDYRNIVYADDVGRLTENLRKVTSGQLPKHNMAYRLVDKKGNRVWISCRGEVREDERTGSLLILGRISDTVHRYKVDELTGLFNKIKLQEDLEDELIIEKKGYLMMIGIDNLKNINMKHGRKIGDKTVKYFAKKLEEEVSSMSVYRLESGCFAIYLENIHAEGIRELYERIKIKIANHFTISAGAATLDGMTKEDTERLYLYAEYALDESKKEGKGELEFFEASEYNVKLSSIELLEELGESVQNGCSGFSLVYQPQIKEGTYQLYGAEALLRYDSPKRGRVMPGDFVPLLEQTGLICTVGLWVLKTALTQCKKWRTRMPQFHISVNMSYVQLMESNIKEDVLKILRESGLSGEALTLEVTESVQLQNFQYYNEIFSEWRKAGIEISVDDFGTGYSSLGYLKNLKIDEIKIDRCFVSGIHNSSYNYRLLCNIVELASSTQIRVCCEGVEEREELQVLAELKPDLLQGYYFSKPCEVEEFEGIYFEFENSAYKKYYDKISDVRRRNVGQLLNLRHREILKNVKMGLWMILLDRETGRGEMYADETMLRIMGADRNLSPAQCFEYWNSRICEDCSEYVSSMVERMIGINKVIQLQYTWRHPELGEIEVRCNGVRGDDVDGRIRLEGYHRIISDMELTEYGMH